jgi:nucleotide-binding universal stress UspA family protein
MIPNRLLLAVDDSLSSTRAAEYVGDMLRTTDGHEVHVFHVLPPVPPFNAEAPGRVMSDDLEPAEVDAEWLQQREIEARPMLDQVRALLVRAGIHESFIETKSCPSKPLQTVAQAILDEAEELDCGTIVVGRTDLPWYRRILRRHIGDELVGKAGGRSVWVVE